MSPQRQAVERRLINEWMAERYAGQTYYLNYPLGPLPAGFTDEKNAFPWLRKVDGLAIADHQVHLVEAKVWKPTDGLDKLPSYKAVVPHTPWLGEARNYPVKMILLTPRSNAAIEGSAAVLGIELVLVSGGWIDEVVAHIEWLWTREGRDFMADRRKMRDYLGLG